jgi:hypothetical protein
MSSSPLKAQADMTKRFPEDDNEDEEDEDDEDEDREPAVIREPDENVGRVESRRSDQANSATAPVLRRPSRGKR